MGCGFFPTQCTMHYFYRLRRGLFRKMVGFSLAVSLATACKKGEPSADESAVITFKVDGAAEQPLTKSAIASKLKVETITSLDPYYHRKKTYRAVPLKDVLELGFAPRKMDALVKESFILRANDGYTVPMAGSRLFEPGGYVALED